MKRAHGHSFPNHSLITYLCIFFFLAGALGLPVSAEARARKRARPARVKVANVSQARTSEGKAVRPRPKGDTFEGWTSRIAHAEENMGEQWSVQIEDVNTTQSIFSYQPSRRLVPASNRKLITMALALELLGPSHQFTTEFGLSAPHEQGRAHYYGDVILRSDGDPSLTEPFLRGNGNPAAIFRTWAKALSDTGIAYVHGDLVVDASAFGEDQNSYPAVWIPAHRNLAYAPVPSALAVCQNLLRVAVEPASRSGLPGQVRLFPSEEGIAVVNNTRTSSRRSQGGVTAVFDQDNSTLVLSGSLPLRGGGEVALVPLPQPLQYIGQIMRQAIAAAGVRLTGGVAVRTGPAPTRANSSPVVQRLGVHESPPLAEMLLVMMRQSNNFLAEQIWRAAAARATGRGDVANARRVESAWYGRHKLPWIEPGWDGSGLSRRGTISAAELVTLIKYLDHTAYHDLLLQLLPTAGKNGTMRHRASERTDGRVTAKTGTLAGVSALSGFILDRQGAPRFAFSAIGNARGESHGRLSGRINDLMSIAVKQLDADIAAGRRPEVLRPDPALPPTEVTHHPALALHEAPETTATLSGTGMGGENLTD